MLSLFIKDRDLVIKDVEKTQLTKITEWFTGDDINLYKYAMGVDKPITYDDLYEKYLEALINAHEYFLGISLNGKLVGFFKGRVDYKNPDQIWIMAALIDTPYRNIGIGRRALKLIMKEFKEKYGINNFYACLVKENIRGKIFWQKNGFYEYRLSKGYFTINNKSYDLVIMNG